MTTRKSLNWIEPPAITPDSAFCRQIGGHPLVAQILARRGFTTPEAARAFLDPGEYSPAPPEALPDLAEAVVLLNRAIQHEQTILVWGDFDVDGQTATALLVDALTRLGAHVVYYIPHRLRESHGIQLSSLQDQIDQHHPALLLTCDTGISAHEAVDYAKMQNLAVIITDHHDLPPELPAADAVVNPKRLPPSHPLRALPGVGVAYKLIEALYTQYGWADDLLLFLDLVALGIVADVADLSHDTRYLLQIGLDCLRHTRRIGLQALIEVAALSPDHLSATDIGFQLGPRLNSAGRLDDARPAVELLITSDRGRARLLAVQLEGLNQQRRQQNRQIYAAAQEMIARDPAVLDWEALVLASPHWHAGLIGIVASRLAEQYERPVVLLTIGEEGIARGSARSVPGYDIGAAIAAQADLLIEFGGHPGAAGLSLHENHIPAFRRRLSNTLRAIHDPSARPGLVLDAVVTLADLTPDLAADLNRLAPFGEGNPRIRLATANLTLKSAAYVGVTQQHRRLTVTDFSGNKQIVMWWDAADQPLPEGLFDIAYELDMGANGLELVLLDYRRAASAPIEVVRPPHEVIDHRTVSNPAAVLAQYPGAMIWAEGFRRENSPGLPLAELGTADTLIVYTIPPSGQAIQEALERVNPYRVVLLAEPPPYQHLKELQRRLLELVKYVINRQEGRTTLSALAGAVAHTRGTVRLLLDYHVALGEFRLDEHDDTLRLMPGDGTASGDPADVLAAVQTSIAETAAYRAYFQRADPYHLLGWDKES